LAEERASPLPHRPHVFDTSFVSLMVIPVYTLKSKE
jgi:hypothetical protein